MEAYTLAEAQEELARWKECERQLATGQAKQYKIGTREFHSIDLPYIVKQINRFSNIVARLQGTARSIRVQRVVFRD